MSAEAAELATASFGDVMLKAIGQVYESQAEICMGGFIDGNLAALRYTAWVGLLAPEAKGSLEGTTPGLTSWLRRRS